MAIVILLSDIQHLVNQHFIILLSDIHHIITISYSWGALPIGEVACYCNHTKVPYLTIPLVKWHAIACILTSYDMA